MKSIWISVQLGLATIGGFLGWFLGGLDGFLYALVAFVVLDYITGVMLAVLEKSCLAKLEPKASLRRCSSLP